ncbi:c-type cytochrome [Thermoleophilia bacterium SCSIO 60948]|nr:c-type cytochrome [Thermoleophilia bacterium SCSIO 60948]
MLATVSLAAAVASGCGAGAEPDLERGRALFSANCGSCHALEQAGSSANVGPDLDAAFGASRRDGLGTETIAGVVRAQIENPRPTSLEPSDPRYNAVYMPADLVEGQDLDDVSAYIATVAGSGVKPPPFTAEGYFSQNCGGCHTLQAAGTSGNTGPNLDTELGGQDVEDVVNSIANPSDDIVEGYEDVMPQNYGDDLDPEEIDELAQYILTGETGEAAAGGNSGR